MLYHVPFFRCGSKLAMLHPGGVEVQLPSLYNLSDRYAIYPANVLPNLLPQSSHSVAQPIESLGRDEEALPVRRRAFLPELVLHPPVLRQLLLRGGDVLAQRGVERDHARLDHVLVPEPQQVREDVRVAGGQVMHLAEVAVEIVQLPLVRAARGWEVDRLPAALTDGGSPAGLPAVDELVGVDAGSLPVEPGDHAFASHADDVAAAVGRGGVGHAGHLEDRRGDVHDGGELVADAARGHRQVGIPGGELGHEGNPDASFRCVRLVEPTWRGGRLRPSRTIPDEGIVVAEILQAVVVILLEMLHRAAMEHRGRFVGTTLRAIVGHEHDEGVVVFSYLFQMLDYLPHVVIDALHHPRVHLHGARRLGSLLRRHLAPVRNFARLDGVGLDVFRHQPHRLQPCQTTTSQNVGPVVIDAAVGLDIFFRGLQRPVGCGEGVIGKEGLAFVLARLPFLEVALEDVAVAVGGVPAFGELVDVLIILHVEGQRGLKGSRRLLLLELRFPAEMVGGAREVGEGALEAAGPRRALLGEAEVPLAREQRVVVGVMEQLGHGDDALIEVALVPGLAPSGGGTLLDALGVGAGGDGQPFDEGPQAGDVVVGAGQYLARGGERRRDGR